MRRLIPLLLLLPGCDDDPGATPDAATPPPANWEAAFDPGAAGALLSVWGTGPTDVWAVGGQPDHGVAWHRGADGWTEAELPDVPLLNWVYGVGGEVWMVGNEGKALRSTGGAFEEIHTGTNLPLWGIWGATKDDLWAVGGDAFETEDPAPVLLHWNGSEWSAAGLPGLDRPLPALFKVWGTSAGNVFAVGSSGVAIRWDGSAWSQTLTGAPDDLISVWGSGPEDIVAVGGRRNGIVARWDGSAWTSTTLRTAGLNGVWVGADGTATLVGDRATILRLAPGSDEPERESNDANLLLHAVWGDGAGYRATVGGSLNDSPPWQGLALEVTP